MHNSSAREYYEKLGCKVGYSLLMGGSQHFGLHPVGKKISEAEAQKNHHDELANALEIQKDMHLLDAGSGQGFVSCDLADRYDVDVTGIDITPYLVKKAQRRAAIMHVTQRTRYLLGNYAQIPFCDNCFDGVYTTESLCHADNLPQVLSELHRVLKPEGKAVFMEYRNAEQSEYSTHEREMYDFIVQDTHSPSLDEFQGDNFLSRLEKAGFTDISFTDKSKNFLPSLKRLHSYAKYPHAVVSSLGLEKKFVNVAIAIEFYQMAIKDLIGFGIYSGKK